MSSRLIPPKVLAITATHHGYTTDHDIRLTSLNIRLTDGANDTPLTTEQANTLFSGFYRHFLGRSRHKTSPFGRC